MLPLKPCGWMGHATECAPTNNDATTTTTTITVTIIIIIIIIIITTTTIRVTMIILMMMIDGDDDDEDDDDDDDDDDRIERRISRFLTISSLRRELFPVGTLKWPGRNRVQITCNTSNAYHVQRTVCHVLRKDSSAIKSGGV